MKARVSIVMCTCNGAEYIQQQLDSLFRQTLPFYELVVQDDCSDDETCAIVEQCAADHPERRIRLFRNHKRKGWQRNFLTAVVHCEGDFVAWCDQDDVWHDDKLQVLADGIGDSQMIFSNSNLIDEQGRKQGVMYSGMASGKLSPLASAIYPRGYGHQMLFTIEVAQRLYEFSEMKISYDYLTCCVASALGGVRYVDKPLVDWRRHSGAATFNPTARHTSKIQGYVLAVKALKNSGNRERTREFFRQLSLRATFYDRALQRVVDLMAAGTTPAIVRACLVCLSHSKVVEPHAKGITRLLRAFFLPMMFIRDHGRYIVELP